MSYDSPISRFCPSGDASYGERPSDLAKFSALLGFSPFFSVFPPIDKETLYARAPCVSARADGTNLIYPGRDGELARRVSHDLAAWCAKTEAPSDEAYLIRDSTLQCDELQTLKFSNEGG